MSPRFRALLGVVVMSALLALYFVFVGVRAVALLSSATPIAIALGVALLVLPLIGAWALIRELRFGFFSTRLVDRLSAADRLPSDLGAASPSGRPDRDAADAAFARYRDDAETDPGSWEAWARLGIVYDASGDRRRARAALREAITCERRSRRGGDPRD